MTGSLDGIVLGLLLEMCQNRVVWSRFIRTVDKTAACYRHPMSELGAAFGNEQIVPSVLLIYMRCLRIASACSVPYHSRLRQLFACVRIDLAHDYSVVAGTAVPAFPIFIPEKRRVDSGHVNPHWIRPLSSRILCRHYEIAFSADICRYHVEPPVVMSDDRCEYSSP